MRITGFVLYFINNVAYLQRRMYYSNIELYKKIQSSQENVVAYS